MHGSQLQDALMKLAKTPIFPNDLAVPEGASYWQLSNYEKE